MGNRFARPSRVALRIESESTRRKENNARASIAWNRANGQWPSLTPVVFIFGAQCYTRWLVLIVHSNAEEEIAVSFSDFLRLGYSLPGKHSLLAYS